MHLVLIQSHIGLENEKKNPIDLEHTRCKWNYSKLLQVIIKESDFFIQQIPKKVKIKERTPKDGRSLKRGLKSLPAEHPAISQVGNGLHGELSK